MHSEYCEVLWIKVQTKWYILSNSVPYEISFLSTTVCRISPETRYPSSQVTVSLLQRAHSQACSRPPGRGRQGRGGEALWVFSSVWAGPGELCLWLSGRLCCVTQSCGWILFPHELSTGFTAHTAPQRENKREQ